MADKPRFSARIRPTTARAMRRLRAIRTTLGQPDDWDDLLSAITRDALRRLEAEHPELGELARWPDWNNPIPQDFPRSPRGQRRARAHCPELRDADDDRSADPSGRSRSINVPPAPASDAPGELGDSLEAEEPRADEAEQPSPAGDAWPTLEPDEADDLGEPPADWEPGD